MRCTNIHSCTLLLLWLVANAAGSAGLNFSTRPLFVTDVLPPNVILSPAYTDHTNEVAMKNPPQEMLLACLKKEGSCLAREEHDPKGDPNYKSPDPYFVLPLRKDASALSQNRSWERSVLFDKLYRRTARVTPWPDVKPCKAAVLANVNTMIDMGCSDAIVYPGDHISFLSGDVQNKALRYMKPLGTRKINGVEYGMIDTLSLYDHISEEPYFQEAGQTKDIGSNTYDGARSKYLRSTDNFLYFNPSLSYQAWPDLGVASDVFSTIQYGTDKADADGYDADVDPTFAYYNPLNAKKGFRARLSKPDKLNNLVYVWDGPGDNAQTGEWMEYQIGRYYLLKDGGEVWRSDDYTEYLWEQFDSDKKKQFATWFTYWRSSYLATRGMLANLVKALNDRDMLHLFRLGLHYASYADIDKNDRPVYESEELNVYFDAPSYNYRKLKEDPNYRSDKNTEFMKRFGEKLFSANIYFNFWQNDQIENRDHVYEFFKTAKPYRDDPTSDASTPRSCRRNYEIIVTPDYSALRKDWFAEPSPRIADEDGDKSLGDPYSDKYSNTWGDFGAKGWKTDLMPEPEPQDVENDCKKSVPPCLDDDLLPGKDNEATHQHLVRYLIGPKVEGRMFPSTIRTYSEAKKIAGSPGFSWFDVNSTSVQGGNVVPKASFQDAIDDLWHMVLNSRGMFYPSANVKEAVDNLLVAFNDILVRNVSGASVATNTTSLQEGGVIYQATVESDWRGHLRAYAVAKDDGRLNVKYEQPLWDLAETLSNSENARSVFTYDPDTQTGVDFDWDAINKSASLLKSVQNGFSALDAGDFDCEPKLVVGDLKGGAGPNTVLMSLLPAYIKGASTCEGLESCAVGAKQCSFRRRSIESGNTDAYNFSTNPNGRNILGDIANSNPWVVSAPIIGVSDVDYPGYNVHRNKYKTRPSVLFVGANDGMLHAVKIQDNGKPLFSYIPSFVVEKLPSLATITYGHEFYVDGSPFSAEVMLGEPGKAKWATVLAGSANSGGRGYYLLDITNLAEGVGKAVDLIKWEFTYRDDNDMHYSFNLPVAYPDGHPRAGQARQLARMKDGQWAMIVGNGYQKQDEEDGSGSACLFIINLNGAGEDKKWTLDADYHKLCAGTAGYVGDGGLSSNGLSTPTPYDKDGDGYVDYIYAGDINGNMWKFDVSSSKPNEWVVAYDGSPVFVARSGDDKRQPIIAPPEIMSYSSDGITGQLLLFGTGKYIVDTDRIDSQTQSFYGVWDRGVGLIQRGNLLDQSFTISDKFRTQANRTSPVYCTKDTLAACVDGLHLGWRFDLSEDGERLTGRINLYSGNVYFNTFFPKNEGGELDPCAYGGDGWIMGLDALSGHMGAERIFDTNQDGVIDDKDTLAAGVKIGAAIGGTTFARGLNEGRVGVYSPSNLGTAADEGKKMLIATAGDSRKRGRVSWYELLD